MHGARPAPRHSLQVPGREHGALRARAAGAAPHGAARRTTEGRRSRGLHSGVADAAAARPSSSHRPAQPELDAAVVGGGIAGLLAAYRLLQRHPSWRVTVLESARHVGGRTHTSVFAGTTVSTGAGVGRSGKDVRLASLLEELGLPIQSRGATADADARQVRRLALLSAAQPRDGATFRSFARGVLGDAELRAFVTTMGHTDMLEASARETMLHYGLEDNVHSWTPFSVPWNALCETLRKRVQAFPGGHVLTGARVARIRWPRSWADCACAREGDKDSEGQGFRHAAAAAAGARYALSAKRTSAPPTADTCATCAHPGSATAAAAFPSTDLARLTLAGGTVHLARRVIVAVPIDSMVPLLPRWFVPHVSRIRGHPFIRVYARVARAHVPLVAAAVGKFRVVSPSPLMKMSAVDAASGTFMVAFADGPAAVHLAKHLEAGGPPRPTAPGACPPKQYLEALVTEALDLSGAIAALRPSGRAHRRSRDGVVRLTSFAAFWFPVGTHYYEPRTGTRAEKGTCSTRMFVVGEAVSHNQGWTEGALETVDAVVPLVH